VKSNYETLSSNEGNMKKITIMLLILLAVMPAAAFPIGLSSARAMAMGGAYIGLAKGVYAPLYNPANIGLSGYRQTGLELAGIGAEISNNSFTLSDYNSYTGAILTDNDKSTILGKIPAQGLKITADIEASVMSLSLGSFVLSLNGSAATEVNLGKDALELFLEGNGLADTFSLDGMYSEAIAFASAGLSYGTTLMRLGSRFNGEGTMIARTASGGTGYSTDIGAALKLSKSYTAGITLRNFLSHMTWNKNTEEHGYHFSFDSLTLATMNDSIVVSDEYSKDIPGFESTLPTVMRMGLAHTTGKLLWAVDWEQGFRLAAGATSKPRFSAGAEYRLLHFLPLRGGYSLGGGKGSVISGGMGFDLAFFYLDLAISNHSGFNFNESKGLHLALSTGLEF
jgi:hypothetical protein